MSQQIEIVLQPPHGIAFIQQRGGAVHARLIVADAPKLKLMLLQAAKQCQELEVKRLEVEREKELNRRKLPPSKLEEIEKQLAKQREELIAQELDNMTDAKAASHISGKTLSKEEAIALESMLDAGVLHTIPASAAAATTPVIPQDEISGAAVVMRKPVPRVAIVEDGDDDGPAPVVRVQVDHIPLTPSVTLPNGADIENS